MDEIKYSLNYVKDNKDSRDFLGSELIGISSAKKVLVETNKFDYTKDMTPIKDQGDIGSCVGFAISAVKEWQEQQEYIREIAEGSKYRKRRRYYDLSEQWIYYKTKEIDPWPNEEGTSFRYALKVLNKQGVPCEEGWKYNAKDVGKPEVWAPMIAKWYLCGSYYRLKNLASIVSSLETFGPLVIGVECFWEIFGVGKTGIVPMPRNPNRPLGGHAVCLVGYDPKKRLLKFKNSWGKTWGKSGYGFLPFSYVRKYMIDSWVIKDISVTRDMLKKKSV